MSNGPPPVDRHAVQRARSPPLGRDDPQALLARRPFPARLVPAILSLPARLRVGTDGNRAIVARGRLARGLEVAVVEQDRPREGARVETRVEPLEARPGGAVVELAGR